MPLHIPLKVFSRLIAALSLMILLVIFYTTTSQNTLFNKQPSNYLNIDGNGTTSLLGAPRFRNHSPGSVLTDGMTNENSSYGVIRFGDGREKLKIALVLCGRRLNQTIVTLKSTVILSRKAIHIILLADDENRKKVKKQLLHWIQRAKINFTFEIHPISFPNGEVGEEWRKLFKLCACQRLFLPSILQHVDSLLYVDTDIIFLRPVEQLWEYFFKMNASQIAALTPEHEDFSTGWYNRFARHPYYEPLGVNSGVMLMNLTRMRAFNWESYLQPIIKEYKLKIVWGDQDIINIIFHYHPEKLYILPCEWNFRPDHCMYSSVCKTAETQGIAVVHGNRGVFHNNKQPVFKSIYKAMANYEIGKNMIEELLRPARNMFLDTSNTNCGKLTNVFIRSLNISIFKRHLEDR